MTSFLLNSLFQTVSGWMPKILFVLGMFVAALLVVFGFTARKDAQRRLRSYRETSGRIEDGIAKDERAVNRRRRVRDLGEQLR